MEESSGVCLAGESAVLGHVSNHGANLEPTGRAVSERFHGTNGHDVDVLHTLTVFEFESAVLGVRYRDKSLLLVDNHIELGKGLFSKSTGHIPQRVQRHRRH